MAVSVQGHRLPLLQEVWPCQSLFGPLVAGDRKASGQSFSVALPIQALRGFPVQALCTSEQQSLKEAPGVGSYSAVQCIRHLMGQPLCSAADAGMWGDRGYGGGFTPYT